MQWWVRHALPYVHRVEHFQIVLFLDFHLVSVIFGYVRRLLIYCSCTRFLTGALKDIILFIFAKWKHRMIKNTWINCLNTRGLKLVQKIKTTFQNITGIREFNLLSPGSHLSFFTPDGNVLNISQSMSTSYFYYKDSLPRFTT